MSNGVKSWSWSTLSLYEQCPFKFKLEKLDKVKVPAQAPMVRGNKIHNEAEKYLTGQLNYMPESLAQFEQEFIELKALDPFTEQEWAFKKDWSDTHWRDWTGCWLRGKVDAGLVYADNESDIIDFKTGKPKDNYHDQTELFAVMTFLKFPFVKNVRTRLWYLDTGDEVIGGEFNRSILKGKKHDWEQRIKPMFNDTNFAPKPNRFCDWCHHRKSNGGPCPHS